jgi:hypothetical protein
MATLQLAVCGVVFIAGAPVAGGLPAPHRAVEWRAIAFTSLGCGAVAFVVQSWAQRRTAPARAAVILAGEPPFAAIAGWLLAGDRIAFTGWLGAAIMLGAVFYVASRSDQQTAEPPGPAVVTGSGRSQRRCEPRALRPSVQRRAASYVRRRAASGDRPTTSTCTRPSASSGLTHAFATPRGRW